jgi:hypothetical protein
MEGEDILRTIGAAIGVCIFAGLVWLWVREIKYDLNVVDTKVELEDGTVYLCAEADPRRDGMTYIRKPANTGYPWITIPTKTIKMITRFK